MSGAAVDDPFRLRRATAADAALLAALGAETFAATFAADNTPADMQAYLAASFSPEQQARELADPSARFLILELGGEPVGYVRLAFGDAPAAVLGRKPMEIVRIYARPGWIGRGVGARLMQACLNEAERAGCDVAWLGVWQRNARAIAFYRKWGFEVIGTQTFKLGADVQDDWIMARAIAAARSVT